MDVRGRSRTLHVNYRTSHQIRAQADKLLGPEVSDVDGNVEDRRGTVSVFNGPTPEVLTLDDTQSEETHVSKWIAARTADGMLPHELGVLCGLLNKSRARKPQSNRRVCGGACLTTR